ncbi:MAG: hypothetical protein LUG98_07255 [Tannerellaceae bacterium]|nr:hypothetical protein [Tannerellaceae bacterium]
MKTTHIFFWLLLLVTAMACKDDSADNPVFGAGEIPYIYSNLPETLNATTAEPLNFSVQISPADGSVSVKWLLDGTVISTTKELGYTVPVAGSYALRLEAERNGKLNYRDYLLNVAEAAE